MIQEKLKKKNIIPNDIFCEHTCFSLLPAQEDNASRYAQIDNFHRWLYKDNAFYKPQ